MIVLGIDPGEANFGYGVIDLKRLRVLEYGQITHTLRNLTPKPLDITPKAKKTRAKKNGVKVVKDFVPPFSDAFKAYRRTILKLMRDYPSITEVYSERFQTRGVKSRSVETVSMMNGVIATLCFNKHLVYQPIIAATWKNKVNKTFNLDEAYEKVKQHGVSPHEFDGTLIAFTRGGQIPPPPLNKVLKAMDLG